MTNVTLAKKLQKLVDAKKISKSSLVYGWMQDLITKGNKKEFRVNCTFSQGSSWKFSSLIDKTDELVMCLNDLKIKFTQRNDSPRGGKTGNHIVILTKVSI